ncbi:MAG: hypothetical protein M3464_16660 [Chloroflexota bacterium]|nr:hypothetical protein [Chloroflexota bacterium]
MEAVGLRKRTIVGPRRPNQETALRAARFQELGLVRSLDDTNWTPDGLAGLVQELLAAPPPEHRLDLDGLSRVVDVIEERLKS